MRILNRTSHLIPILLFAAACGGSPAGPAPVTGGGGATIAGTVSFAGSNKAFNAMTGTPAAGLTVQVVGTNLSATTNVSGYFQIGSVPAGRLQLQFGTLTSTPRLICPA